MEPQTPPPKPRKKGMRRFFTRFLLLLILILAGIFIFTYWGVYDKGIRAGNVVRISQKGVIFKTYEGQLNLQSFGALKNASPFVETFDFSVEKGNTQVIRDLEAVALTGERVNLHYIKRYSRFPWRGETKYFVTQVERTVGTPQNN
jgi:hypothetical protein